MKKILPSGKMLFEMMKSSRSIIVETPLIGKSIPLQTLNPRQQGMLNVIIIIKLMITLFLRDHPLRSIQNAIMFSKTAINVDSAAKLRNMKNSVPQMFPNGIFENTFGRVSNTRLGPLPGLTP